MLMGRERTVIAVAVGMASVSAVYYYIRSKKKKVPGPPTYPIICNFAYMWPFIRRNSIEKLHLSLFSKYGPIVKMKLFMGMPTVYSICDAATCKRILTDPNFIRNDRFKQHCVGLFDYALFVFPTDNDWFRHRKLIQPAFGPGHLKHAASISDELILKAISYWKSCSKDGQTVIIKDFRKDISMVTLDVLSIVAFGLDPNSIVKRAEGVDDKDSKVLDDILMVIAKRYGRPMILWNMLGVGPDSPQVKEIINPLRNKISKMIEEVKNQEIPREERQWNVIERLFYSETKNGDYFTEEEIMGEVIGFFGAGLETTATNITWALIEIGRHPDVARKILDEYTKFKSNTIDFINLLPKLTYLDMVVKEVQRLHCTVFNLGRQNTEPVEILGYELPANSIIFTNIMGVHHNPDYWPEPNVFNPDRFAKAPIPGTFFPFGDGPHNCIGFKMALIETKILLLRILEHFEVTFQGEGEIDSIATVTRKPRNNVELILKY